MKSLIKLSVLNNCINVATNKLLQNLIFAHQLQVSLLADMATHVNFTKDKNACIIILYTESHAIQFHKALTPYSVHSTRPQPMYFYSLNFVKAEERMTISKNMDIV